MPIRFRCVYCEQLLGIAKRKAGTVVKCPNCSGQVIVPSPEAGADDSADPEDPTAEAEPAQARELATVQEKTAPAPPPTTRGEGGMLFERSDFDELLKPVLERKEPGGAGKASRTPRKPASPALNAFDFSAPERAAPAAAKSEPAPVVPAVSGPAISGPAKLRSGVFLSPVKLILLAVVVMAGMAFTFGGGLLLGLYLGRR
jgi:hypothetical protein